MSTEIDATIYAYISILYYIPLANNPIKTHIHECPNLLQFLEKFGKKFLSNELKQYALEKPVLSTNDPTNSETKNLSTHGPKIISVIVALAVMTAYAIRNGIFSVSFFLVRNQTSDSIDILLLHISRFHQVMSTT